MHSKSLRYRRHLVSYRMPSRGADSRGHAARLVINGLAGAGLASGGGWNVWAASEPPPVPHAAPQARAATLGWHARPKAPAGAPNVVVILLDDVGFGATSAFGGPVATPALEQLAAEGLRYNRFHTAALSSPTRASLLTGRNHHQVGFGSVTETASNYPGYNSLWPKSAATIPEILRRNGYSTAGFGKWHNTPTWETGPSGPFDRWPNALGFEYYYGFQGGETSQWDPAAFRNNLVLQAPGTSPDYHLTTDIADDAIAWMHTHEASAPGKPYFLYFATGAVHAPHHVPQSWIDKYRGKFDQGWDKLREETFARQQTAGIVPAGTELTARPAELPAWDSLDAERKRLFAHQMEVFAGFLEQTDHEVGRVLDAVRQGPDGDNTLVLYIVGDNGGSPEGGLDGSDINMATFFGIPNPVSEQLAHIDELGGDKWDNHFSTPWAWAIDAPFQWTKQVASHFGAMRNGLVVSWPRKLRAHGEMRGQFGHVNDIAPTIFEATGIRFPSEVDGVKQLPIEGASLVTTFNDAGAPERHRKQYFEMLGNRSIYVDGWVAGARHGVPWRLSGNDTDFGRDRWELYHVAEDFSEAHDVADKYPRKLAELKREFEHEARRNQVLPLQPPDVMRVAFSDKPTVIGDTKVFHYHLDEAPLSAVAVPSYAKPHRLVARIEAAAGAQGVIVAQGGHLGGFALYVKDGRLVYENNFFGKTHDILVAPAPLPDGEVEVAVEYAPAGGQHFGGGTLRLEVNGSVVAERALERVGLAQAGESFDIGRDRGTAVSDAYRPPFAFTGRLREVSFLLR